MRETELWSDRQSNYDVGKIEILKFLIVNHEFEYMILKKIYIYNATFGSDECKNIMCICTFLNSIAQIWWRGLL
jgi:hypothetical protein